MVVNAKRYLQLEGRGGGHACIHSAGVLRVMGSCFQYSRRYKTCDARGYRAHRLQSDMASELRNPED